MRADHQCQTHSYVSLSQKLPYVGFGICKPSLADFTSLKRRCDIRHQREPHHFLSININIVLFVCVRLFI